MIWPRSGVMLARDGADLPHADGQPFHLYQHQVEAMELARTGQSYVVTSGTGSGKSLTYFLPIIDPCCGSRPPATGSRRSSSIR